MQTDLEARGVGYDRAIEPPTAGALMAQPAFMTVTITHVMPSQSAHLCTSQWAKAPLHIQLFDSGCRDIDPSVSHPDAKSQQMERQENPVPNHLLTAVC